MSGILSFLILALLLSVRLWDFMVTTEDIVVRVGRVGRVLTIDPDESPLQYLLLISVQFASIIGCLVLAYSEYSHRED